MRERVLVLHLPLHRNERCGNLAVNRNLNIFFVLQGQIKGIIIINLCV
jgi:hypothetical protein